MTVLGNHDLWPELEKQLRKWHETYYLQDDVMLIVARHYRWKEDRMIEWFSKTVQDEYNIGVLPKQSNDPAMQASLLKNNPDLICPSCYEEMEMGSISALECGHTFCDDCWTQFCLTEVTLGTKALNQCEALCM